MHVFQVVRLLPLPAVLLFQEKNRSNIRVKPVKLASDSHQLRVENTKGTDAGFVTRI